MQQQQQMASSFPPTNITTEQIQKGLRGHEFLDENKQLILAIMNNQNLGKLAECAQYQAVLQKNLMYLAAIADAQLPTPTVPSQMAPHPAMQQGGFYMQHPQAVLMAHQPSSFPQQVPLQVMQAQMPMRPGGAHNGINKATLSGSISGGPPTTSGPSDVWRGNMQDASEAGPSGSEEAK